MALVEVGVGLLGFLVFLGIIMLLGLFSIAETLKAERQRHLRLEEILRLAWFRQQGQFFRGRSGHEECVCSEESPCMWHYGVYHRWCVGATEAEAIANELAALLKD